MCRKTKVGDHMTKSSLPVAVLVAAGFEETHMTEFQKALLAIGIDVKVISPEGGLVQGWHDNGWGHHFMADDSLAEVLSADFSALIVPAGERAIASLKQKPHSIRLLKAFADAQKPIVVLGEAAALFVAAEIAAGVTFAGDDETREALQSAGATISDENIHHFVRTMPRGSPPHCPRRN